MRDRAHAHRDVQRVARLGQVVGVARLAADVQRRRIVRQRATPTPRWRAANAGGGCGRVHAPRGEPSSTRVERVAARDSTFQPEAAQQVAEHGAAVGGGRAHVVDRREFAGERARRRPPSRRPTAARRAPLRSRARASGVAATPPQPMRAARDAPSSSVSAKHANTAEMSWS